jgi:hypothetical protein
VFVFGAIAAVIRCLEGMREASVMASLHELRVIAWTVALAAAVAFAGLAVDRAHRAGERARARADAEIRHAKAEMAAAIAAAIASGQLKIGSDFGVVDPAALEQAEIRERVWQARVAADRAERVKGVHVTQECLNNPLAKGCL